MFCHQCVFSFNGDPWKCDMSPCDMGKAKTLFYKSTTLTCWLALPVKLQEQHTRGGSDADPRRQNACLNVVGWRGNTLGCPWRGKAETMGALTFCFFLPPFQSFLQSLTLLPSAPSSTERPRNEVGSGDMYICLFAWKSQGNSDGAHYWQTDKDRRRRRRRGRVVLWHKAIWWGGWDICCVLQSSAERALTVNLWALRLSFSWQNSHCVLLCYLSLLYFTHEDAAESSWQSGTSNRQQLCSVTAVT